jgi:6-phosphogluconolactonase (cycloisomerase 2 family)
MRARKHFSLAAVAAIGALAALGGTAPAFAAGTGRAVFVQTDNVKGNQVVVYDRAASGTLTQVGIYNTGGLGGALEGSVVDHLASEGGLTYDGANGLLYAVNAGSNTVSVFGVIGDKLALHQVISSGGTFPVSVAAHEGTVYVLNGLSGGAVQGFAVASGRLVALPGSNRPLGLEAASGPSQFTHSPGTVVFSPNGAQLLVTTKANGNDVDVFSVAPGGVISATPVVNSLPGTVPFGIVFDKQGHVVLAESAGALASFQLGEAGTLSQLDVVLSEQAATCWVEEARGHFFTSNPGSASLSAFSSSAQGQLLTLLGDTPTNGGTVDATSSASGRFLYVQTGAEGLVDEFAVGSGGELTDIGFVSVPGAIGGEGIAAG